MATQHRSEHAEHSSPRFGEHSGLDNDEATAKGKLMTASGSKASHPAEHGAPTLDDHPGLDDDEATSEGKMMTALGSAGPDAAERAGGERA